MIAVALPGAEVRFTTRAGGVSAGPYASLNLGLWSDDDPHAVQVNHELLRNRLGLERLSVGRQVHGRRVVEASAGRDVAADGRVTTARGIGVLVLTADCLPVAITTPGAVAMVHAGWRGLLDGVLEAGVAAVRAAGAGLPVSAAIGPGAGPCCYEVGEEVHGAFAAAGLDGVRVGPRNLDLKRAARLRLEELGAQVSDCARCTICSQDFFSHRRDAGLTGRQAGVAWRS